MNPFTIHTALREVRLLRAAILEKQRFRGYSGRARALGGGLALGAGLVLSWVPGLRPSVDAIMLTWAFVFLGAVGLNYGAVAVWYCRHRDPSNRHRLQPVLEVLPVWLVAGLLTLAVWRQGAVDLLYPLWMLHFGLVQILHRSVLPRAIVWVGVYYLVAGTFFSLAPAGLFHRPLVMGLVFFFGEFAGGLVFHVDGDPARLRRLFHLPSSGN